MPVKLGQREYRQFSALTLGAGEKRLETDHYAEGYATTFGVPYVLWEYEGIEYKEVVDRGALLEADLSDVIFQYDHEGRVLARQRNKTLLVIPDDHGLFIATDLSKGESARQLHEEIANGLIDRMSWSFVVTEDSYDRDTHTRTILKVKKVYDVSAVSIPANDATEISARTWVDGAVETMKRESQARRAQALRIMTHL